MTDGPLIGIAGRARVGKDTAATYLHTRYGCEVMSFAAPLYEGLATMLGLEQADFDGPRKEEVIPWLGVSLRELLQELGTGWGRKRVRSDLWVLVAERRLARLQAMYRAHGLPWAGVVFADLRFPEEAGWLRRRGGRVIHLTRSSAPRVRAHESESGIEREPGDLHLPNEGTLDELYRRLDDILDDAWGR